MNRLIFMIPLLFIATILSFNVMNLQPERVGPPLKPVAMMVVNIPESIDDGLLQHIEQKIGQMPGISAYSINPKSALAAITYFTDITTKEDVSHWLSLAWQAPVVEHVFPEAPAGKVCPVHEPMAWLKSFF